MEQIRSSLSKKTGHPDKPGQPVSPAHHVNRNAVLIELVR
jgi:hypothetical protein